MCVFLVVHAAHRCSCTLDEDVAEMAEHGAGGHSPSFDGRPHVHGASMHEPEPGPGLYYLGEKHDVHSRTNMTLLLERAKTSHGLGYFFNIWDLDQDGVLSPHEIETLLRFNPDGMEFYEAEHHESEVKTRHSLHS